MYASQKETQSIDENAKLRPRDGKQWKETEREMIPASRKRQRRKYFIGQWGFRMTKSTLHYE